MSASIAVSKAPEVQYLLRIGDSCLIMAQRLGEWCGHAPVLEEDIALTNMALDLVGQARAVLTRAGELEAHAGGAGGAAFSRSVSPRLSSVQSSCRIFDRFSRGKLHRA